MNISEKTKCKVPFGTLSVPTEAIPLITEVLEKKLLTNGHYVQQFEKKFADTFNTKYAIAVSSGTDALTIALASLYDYEFVRGDKILVPALTFVSTANAVLNAGFVPKFVDIERETLNINPYELEEAIDEKTKAILAVHLMGNPAKMDKIMEIADKYDLVVIEDCAEAHGANYKNKFVGSFGYCACYSLYAAHMISSVEGGMITTNNEKTYNICKSLRNHGLELQGSNWTFERIGFSAKMNELEAIVGLNNLKNLDKTFRLRLDNFNYLQKAFEELKFSNYFLTISKEDNCGISPHAFPIIVKDYAPFTKQDFVNFLNAKGIDNRNLFYSIPTQCKPYKKYITGTYEEAEFCSNNGTHIGIHQDLTMEQLNYIIISIEEFLNLYI